MADTANQVPAPKAAIQQPTQVAGFQIRSQTSADFDKANYKHQWLVQHCLVRNQPGVVGGPKKAMKTSTIIDLAVSLGTGLPFLNYFPVHSRMQVAVLSGESGPATIQETARRICASKGVSLGDCSVHWSFTLPRLHDVTHLRELGRFLRQERVQVVVIDPLYLCLLAGQRNLQASNLYDIGPILRQASDTCLHAGATPLFVHHATKSATKQPAAKAGKPAPPVEPLDLDDLCFAGVGEFVRQWLLLKRREPYQPGTGRHRLLLTAGGSVGHSGCWEVDIDEGQVGHDLTGRYWRVAVDDVGGVVME